jgi:hypothetical protein
VVTRRLYAGDLPVSTFLALHDPNALIVIDTSALLEIARKTSEENYSPDLWTTLQVLGDRVVIPETVVTEYHDRLPGLLAEVRPAARRLFELAPKQRKYAFDTQIAKAREMLERFAEEAETEWDAFLVELDRFIEDHRLSVLPDDERTWWLTQAPGRYASRTPPGYHDEPKTGDLEIYAEAIALAKARRRDIVFVSEDNKDDLTSPGSVSLLLLRSEMSREFQVMTRGRSLCLVRGVHLIDHALAPMPAWLRAAEFNFASMLRGFEMPLAGAAGFDFATLALQQPAWLTTLSPEWKNLANLIDRHGLSTRELHSMTRMYDQFVFPTREFHSLTRLYEQLGKPWIPTPGAVELLGSSATSAAMRAFQDIVRPQLPDLDAFCDPSFKTLLQRSGIVDLAARDWKKAFGLQHDLLGLGVNDNLTQLLRGRTLASAGLPLFGSDSWRLAVGIDRPPYWDALERATAGLDFKNLAEIYGLTDHNDYDWLAREILDGGAARYVPPTEYPTSPAARRRRSVALRRARRKARRERRRRRILRRCRDDTPRNAGPARSEAVR